MRTTRRGWAGSLAAIIGVALVLQGATACSSDGSGTAAGAGSLTTLSAESVSSGLDDTALAALRSTAEASSFVVEIEAESFPPSPLRYTAPYSYESSDPANPMLVVDGVQYLLTPPPPPGVAVGDIGGYNAIPLSPDAGGPMPETTPFFVEMLRSGSGSGGPGYRIISVETDGSHATVVRAENASGSIVLRFSQFDAPTTPPTTPSNTVVMASP